MPTIIASRLHYLHLLTWIVHFWWWSKYFSVLSKTLKLSSNYSLGRTFATTTVVIVVVFCMKEILLIWATPGGLSRQTFPTTLSITILPLCRQSSKLYSRMVLYAKLMKLWLDDDTLFVVDVGSLSISAFYSLTQNLRDTKLSSNPSSVIDMSDKYLEFFWSNGESKKWGE